MNENINTLDELNKGAVMGAEAITFLIDKVKDKKLRKLLEKQKADYEAIENKVSELYSNYNDKKPHEPSPIAKVMTWYDIEIKTLADESDSKISDLILQGTNMGIIEGRKMINNKKMDKTVKKLVESFVVIQEDYVEKLKKYL